MDNEKYDNVTDTNINGDGKDDMDYRAREKAGQKV